MALYGLTIYFCGLLKESFTCDRFVECELTDLMFAHTFLVRTQFLSKMADRMKTYEVKTVKKHIIGIYACLYVSIIQIIRTSIT